MASENFSTFVTGTATASLTGTEAIPAVQGGVTKQTTPNALAAFIGLNPGPSGPTGPTGPPGPASPMLFLDVSGDEEEMIGPVIGPTDVLAILGSLGGLTGVF